jgi:DNA-binding winged helix-turn-helix (wHTH) protein
MERSAKVGRVLRFEAFEVDLEERELRRSGLKIKIQEQPFQILVLLLERPGAVLTREHLQKALWPDGTFVDFEHGLNTAVKKLREALGDSAEIPHFVETVARRGYRFIGKVEAPVAAIPSARPTAWQRLFTTRNTVLAGLMVGALALSFLYYHHSLRSKTGQLAVTPAVTNVGEKYTPSLSPDGQHLAFVWNGGTGSHFNFELSIIPKSVPHSALSM